MWLHLLLPRNTFHLLEAQEIRCQRMHVTAGIQITTYTVSDGKIDYDYATVCDRESFFIGIITERGQQNSA